MSYRPVEDTCAGCGKTYLRKFPRPPVNPATCSRACRGKVNAARASLSIAERLAKYVVRTDGCWIWTGLTDPDGYGRMGFTANRRTKMVRAHRAAWEEAHGPVPNGQLVLHRCDNPACVRPDHLFLGDFLVNNRDRASKGRSAINRNGTPGEKHRSAKLTEPQVRTIRSLHRKEPRHVTAANFGVTPSTVKSIQIRQSWKHVA